MMVGASEPDTWICPFVSLAAKGESSQQGLDERGSRKSLTAPEVRVEGISALSEQ
jgi:hypothetical protein